MRVAVIIQARMSSRRLPGKVLLELNGETVLSQVIKRCNAIDNVDLVCCAVAGGVDSDLVAEEAKRCGSFVARGPEDDVLGRYYKAAKEINCDVVLRVTSDCPLIDPKICTQVINLLDGDKYNLATNNLPRTWPLGLDCEAFSAELLERAVHEATKAKDREHVTPWMRSNREEVKILNYPAPEPGLDSLRWTLDTERDYRFLRELFLLIPNSEDSFTYELPLSLNRETPFLRDFY